MTEDRQPVVGADPGGGALDRAKRLDWVGTLGPTIADLVGGRAAIVLRGLIRLRSDYRARAQGGADTTPPRGSNDSAGEALELAPEDELAVQFIVAIGETWRRTNPDCDFADFVRDRAIAVWENGTAYREVLASIAWDPDDIRILCRDAGLDMSRVVLHGNAERQWFSVFELLRTQPGGQLLFLLFLASRRYPAEYRLRAWE